MRGDIWASITFTAATPSPSTPSLPLCQWILWHTRTFDTHAFIHACTHAGRTVLRQLSWTCMVQKTGQAGRLMQWYGLFVARRSYCNWSAFQSLSFSKKDGIKADSICWIPLCRAHRPMLRFQLCNYKLWLQSCIEHCKHFFFFFTSSIPWSYSE